MNRYVIVMVIILLVGIVSCAEESQELPPGCIIGQGSYIIDQKGVGTLVSISLSTGTENSLIPHDIAENPSAPAVDVNTSTVYYVDRETGKILSYRPGDQYPKIIYDIYHPQTTNEVYEMDAFDVHWLLLHPTGERLFFFITHGGCEPDDLIEYHLQTGQSRVVLTSSAIDIFQRPAWLDDSTLLVKAHSLLATLSIHSGTLTPVLEDVNIRAFALSRSGKRVLVGMPAWNDYCLYEFPALKLIKTFPPDLFVDYSVDSDFCFTDDDHVLFFLRKHV